jgi:hypothetical protein
MASPMLKASPSMCFRNSNRRRDLANEVQAAPLPVSPGVRAVLPLP